MPISTNPEECIPQQKKEGKPQDQAVAICLNKERSGRIIKSAKLLTAQFEFENSIKKKLT